MNTKQFFRSVVMAIVSWAIFLLPVSAPAKIKDTKHNLSITGPGSIKAASEQQICIFCHTPHNAGPLAPLWNHDPSAVTNYIHYTSDTLQSYKTEAEAFPIDGFSKMCLGCHDGTVAIGALASQEDDVLIVGDNIDGEGKLTGGSGYIGTNLSGGHPISIPFTSALKTLRDLNANFCQLNWPINDPDVKLYPTQSDKMGVQCNSCHNPHDNKSTQHKPGDPDDSPFWPPLWRKTSHDAVCEVCHLAGCNRDFPW